MRNSSRGARMMVHSLGAASPPKRLSACVRWGWAAAIAILVTSVFWPVLSSRALSFDDDQYLQNNRLVQTPGMASLGRFFAEVSKPSTVTGYYQPLAMTSLMLDIALGGGTDNLLPFRRTSLLLHVLNALALFFFLCLLFNHPWAAAAAVAIIALHPVAVEPVAWIAERKTLLAMFFSLLSLIAYVRHGLRPSGSWKWLLASASCYLLALLSKPTSVPLPLLFLVLDYWPLQRISRRSIFEKIPLFALAALAAVVTLVSQRNAAEAAYEGQGGASIPLIVLHNVAFYLWKLIWPVHMSAYYDFPLPVSLSTPAYAIGLAATIMLVILLAITLRWTRAWMASFLFFYIALLPAIGVVGFTHVIAADRHAYLPMIGFGMLLTWLLSRVERNRVVFPGRSTIPLAGGCLVGLVLLEAGLCRHSLKVWRDSETLYRYMLSVAPNAPAVHLNLGVVLADSQRTDAAIVEYRRALQLQPDIPEAMVNLASALSDQSGPTDEVIGLYERALAIKEAKAEPHNNLGFALVQRGRAMEALPHLRRAIELRDNYADAHNNLGLAFAAAGRPDDALQEYKRALDLDPRHLKACNNMGVLFAERGQTVQALSWFERAVAVQPGSAEAHNNLGLALASIQRKEDAIQHFLRAVELNPGFADAWLNLAVAKRDAGALDEAVRHLERTLQLNPSDPAAHLALAEIFERQQKSNEAIRHYRAAMELNPQDDVSRRRLGALSAKSVPAAGGDR